MTSPGTPARRARLVALLVLGVAFVLLISTPTWFAGGRAGIGVAQLVVAALVAGAGVLLYRRAGSAAGGHDPR